MSKKEEKLDLKKAKKIEKEARKNELEKTNKEIQELKQQRKNTKSKEEKKKLSLKIKKLKNKDKGTTFISEVLEEMKLVRWPKAIEVVKYSIASLIFIIIFALFFFGIDALFALVKDLIG